MVEWHADSFINRAEDYWDASKTARLDSTRMTNYFNCSEQSLKAILIKCGVIHFDNSHRLDKTVRKNEGILAPIWDELLPIINNGNYEWLYNWRNTSSYRHMDAPPEPDPMISKADLNRAEKIATSLLNLAKKI